MKNEHYYQIFFFKTLGIKLGIRSRRPWDMGLGFEKFQWWSWDFGKISLVTLKSRLTGPKADELPLSYFLACSLLAIQVKVNYVCYAMIGVRSERDEAKRYGNQNNARTNYHGNLRQTNISTLHLVPTDPGIVGTFSSLSSSTHRTRLGTSSLAVFKIFKVKLYWCS